MEEDRRAAALALSKRVKFVYVTSLDEGGFPETRVMFNLIKTRAKATQVGPAALEREFMNYLGTNTSSRKMAQMRKDQRVCLYYSDNTRFEGCMVRGRVSEISDPAIRKAIWVPAWDMYYPGGMDGGDFSLMLFTPEHVRYYHGLSVADFDA
jgi:general stress protein 26